LTGPISNALFGSTDARYGRMVFFAKDVGAASRSLAFYGEWAENEIQFLKTFIHPGATVVDVGAYVGTHTLAFSRFVEPAGQVLSIEAQPDTFRVLERNVAANHLSNVRLENAAVSDRSGELLIPLIDPSREGSFGSASLRESLSREQADCPYTPGTARVHQVTIDGFGLTQCALIKIDAEGTEHLVVSGAAETISRTSPAIYAECNSLAEGWKTFELLKSFGYEVRLHLVDAFNPDNFRAIAENIMGLAREAALVGVRAADAKRLDDISLRPCELLLRIESIDDLAIGMLNKPQYFEEILRPSAGSRSGGEAWLNRISAFAVDNERLLGEAAWAKDALAEARELSEESAREAGAARSQCDQLSAAAEALRQDAEAARADIASLQQRLETGQAEIETLQDVLRQNRAERDDALALAEAQRTAAQQARTECQQMLEQRNDALALAEAQRMAAQQARAECQQMLAERDDALALADASMRQAGLARGAADRAQARMAAMAQEHAATARAAADRSAAMTQEHAASATAAAELAGKLRAVYASRSWRLTQPLRSIGGLARAWRR
jgi:FkbM family methyltransferase